MKINNNAPKDFQPIELHLTIESQREVEFFCALFNASGHELAKFVNANTYDGISRFGDVEAMRITDGLWQFFDSKKGESQPKGIEIDP